jgi:hypothetical protein
MKINIIQDLKQQFWIYYENSDEKKFPKKENIDCYQLF